MFRIRQTYFVLLVTTSAVLLLMVVYLPFKSDYSTPCAPPILTGEIYVGGFEKTHSELCPSLGADLKLIILITSAPSHFSARSAVRKTWGRHSTKSNLSIVFFLGALPEFLDPLIQAEDLLYGDIVVGWYVDSYTNLTLKILSMLEWVDRFCPLVPRVLKTDDDMFINIPMLVDFVESPIRINKTKTIWGKLYKNVLPRRSKESQFFVSTRQFPGDVFPDYASGPAYLLTSDVIKGMLTAAPSEPYIRVEDVFITGILASKLGVRREHASGFNDKKTMNPCIIKKGISVHMIDPNEQFRLWRDFLNDTINCDDH